MPNKSHGKVIVIVEETVQKVYLLDPDDAKTPEVLGTLQGLVLGQGIEHGRLFFRLSENRPPAILGRWAKKGPPTALFLEAHEKVEEWKRFSGLRIIIPDQDGEPAVETRFTNTTVERRPISKSRK